MPVLLPVAALAMIASAAQATIAPQALNSFSATPAALIGAPVFDTQGKRIGSVASVTARPGGGLWSVTIHMASSTAPQTVLASSASFDGRQVVVALPRPGG